MAAAVIILPVLIGVTYAYIGFNVMMYRIFSEKVNSAFAICLIILKHLLFIAFAIFVSTSAKVNFFITLGFLIFFITVLEMLFGGTIEQMGLMKNGLMRISSNKVVRINNQDEREWF